MNPLPPNNLACGTYVQMPSVAPEILDLHIQAMDHLQQMEWPSDYYESISNLVSNSNHAVDRFLLQTSPKIDIEGFL